MKKGDLYVAWPERRPAHRVFIEVKRVGKDGTWADIFCCTWATGWTKRQALQGGEMPYAEARAWDFKDLFEQENDHMDWLDEREAASA